MTPLLSDKLEEFYEKGLHNILSLIPESLPKDERLAIEATVYISYGFYRAYRKMEHHLNSITSIDGSLDGASDADRRDAFHYAWSTIDAAYAISKLDSINVVRRFLTLSKNTRQRMSEVSKLRNYMDHFASNFKNTVVSKNRFPLFGWLTYQLSPTLLDGGKPMDEYLVVQMGSTPLGETCSFHLDECSSLDVHAAIDNICLHSRKSDCANISRLLIDLTLNLNNFSIDTQKYIVDLISKDEFKGGFVHPFASVTAKRKLPKSEQMMFPEIESILKENSVRIKKKKT